MNLPPNQNQPTSFMKNHIVKKAAWIIAALVVVLLLLWGIVNFMSSSTGLSGDSVSFRNQGIQENAVAPAAMDIAQGGFAPPTTPNTGGYTANLEQYETTDYQVTGRVKAFELFCDTLETLKADDRYDFRTLQSSLNNCRATFYSEEQYANDVLTQLQQYEGVQTSRITESVTRHREQIQSRSNIIRQQLNSVTSTLYEAEQAYDEIAAFARAERDTETYSEAITEKLRQVDQLTQRKISLTSQLDTLAQQAADLNERVGVVQINVSVSRSYTLNPDKAAREWEQAWEMLTDTWTSFGIWLTVYLGIFLLFVAQWSLYLVILLVLARLGYKLARRIWKL